MTRDEADALLREALIEHAAAYGMTPDAAVLDSYAVVAAWEPLDDIDRETEYTVAYHRDRVPAHVGAGLFDIGHDLAMSGFEG